MAKRQAADSEVGVLVRGYSRGMPSVLTWPIKTCPWQEGFWQTNAQCNQKAEVLSNPWLMLFSVLKALWMWRTSLWTKQLTECCRSIRTTYTKEDILLEGHLTNSQYILKRYEPATLDKVSVLLIMFLILGVGFKSYLLTAVQGLGFNTG